MSSLLSFSNSLNKPLGPPSRHLANLQPIVETVVRTNNWPLGNFQPIVETVVRTNDWPLGNLQPIVETEVTTNHWALLQGI